MLQMSQPRWRHLRGESRACPGRRIQKKKVAWNGKIKTGFKSYKPAFYSQWIRVNIKYWHWEIALFKKMKNDHFEFECNINMMVWVKFLQIVVPLGCAQCVTGPWCCAVGGRNLLPVSSFLPLPQHRRTAAILSRGIWIKFVKPLEPVQEKYLLQLPVEAQPNWLGFACSGLTIALRLILEECRAEGCREWCINSSAPIKAACCGWSQTPLCRDLSSRLPKRGDWIHLPTNEGGLRIVHFPSYASTC